MLAVGLAALREFYPNTKQEDWTVEVAGQSVQIVKKEPTHGGVLEFGTELVSAADRSIVAMPGASPGASTAAWIMIQVIELIPSYGQSPIENAALRQRVRAETAAILNINNVT